VLVRRRQIIAPNPFAIKILVRLRNPEPEPGTRTPHGEPQTGTEASLDTVRGEREAELFLNRAREIRRRCDLCGAPEPQDPTAERPIIRHVQRELEPSLR